MKYYVVFLFLCLYVCLSAQVQSDYFQLQQGSEHSGKYRSVLTSDIDTTWDKWQLRGYQYGFNPATTPMYSMVNGILATPYMIQVRGNADEAGRKRWGYHVFEGFARDDVSRITMLVNKHEEEGRPVAEMYYYGAKYGHSDGTYNWFRIGSDVRQHSFMFSRDRAIFYGSLKLQNALTLGKLGSDNLLAEAPEGDDEKNFDASAKHVNYLSLKESEDGTIFYDKDHNIVVIKVEGEWMKVAVEPLPDGVDYDF